MNKSERFFDRTSRMSNSEPSRSALKIMECTKEHLKMDNHILDFGCGSGAITNKLSNSVQKMDAIDFSKGMIRSAKKQAEDDSISNVKYSQTTIFDDRFRENTFDVIVSFNVLHYIEDMPLLMKRINTLLKPKGIFISSTVCLKEKKSGIRLLMWLLSKMRIVPKIFFYKKSDLENFITKEGFDLIKSEAISRLPEYFIIGEKRKLPAAL